MSLVPQNKYINNKKYKKIQTKQGVDVLQFIKFWAINLKKHKELFLFSDVFLT